MKLDEKDYQIIMDCLYHVLSDCKGKKINKKDIKQAIMAVEEIGTY